jgi:hypothetical protein
VKLYKYRDFSLPTEDDFDRLARVLTQQAFWAARPEALNDPEEFSWACDYTPTDRTPSLLTDVLVTYRGQTLDQAAFLATEAIRNERVAPLAGPVVRKLVDACRDQVGLICFGDSGSNPCLWERYAGGGTGICIEVDVADALMNSQIHRVQYPVEKTVHIDTFLEASTPRGAITPLFAAALLSKPRYWSPEAELRFVSKRQNVAVRLAGSRITSLVIGDKLSRDTRNRIERIAGEVPLRARKD